MNKDDLMHGLDEHIRSICPFHYTTQPNNGDFCFDINVDVNNRIYEAYKRGTKDAFEYLYSTMSKLYDKALEDNAKQMNDVAMMLKDQAVNNEITTNGAETKREDSLNFDMSNIYGNTIEGSHFILIRDNDTHCLIFGEYDTIISRGTTTCVKWNEVYTLSIEHTKYEKNVISTFNTDNFLKQCDTLNSKAYQCNINLFLLNNSKNNGI